jgi:hypothetical protein
MNKVTFLILISFAFKQITFSQTIDSVKFDYDKIYGFALDGNISPIFSILKNNGEKKISKKDLTFKQEFENRFKFETDNSSYLIEKKSSIDSLLVIFRDYWRTSLLDNKNNYDTLFIKNYQNFLKEKFPTLSEKEIKEDSTDLYLKEYIKSKNLYFTDGIGKTGKFYDLLVWKTQKDTIYSFKIYNETIKTKVVFMDNFITLGWEEYATLGKYYPGGWTSDAIYCVKSAYDLKSEDFLVSLLAHEGRHYADKKLFPKLISADLEYRAKLTELSIAKKTIYNLLDFFVDNANYESDNGHNVADFCIIRDLSNELFNIEFEKDKMKWHKVNVQTINKVAYKLLQKNTKALQTMGINVEKLIKQ